MRRAKQAGGAGARRAARAVALGVAALLCACGGGGGGGAPVVPAQITDLTGSNQDGAVLLDWSVQSASHQHVLYHSTSPGVDPAGAASIAGVSPPYLHAGLPNDVARHYVVVAVNGGASGPPSNEVAVTPRFAGDPLFKDQWNLENIGQDSAVPGEDANLVPAWNQGFRGEGRVICVVDDGLELRHEDLEANVLYGASHDYADGDDDPTRGEHGTSCAGVAAARGGNGRGVRGAAYRASLIGYSFLADPTTSNQADAMVRGLELVDVSSNSWTSEDGTGNLQPSTSIWRAAIENGLANGRAGLGIVYVIAAGNGHLGATGGFGVADNSNYDGHASFHGALAVGAVGPDGRRAQYSERGANLLVCAPSARTGLPPAPSHLKISTTDRSGAAGYNTDGAGFEYDQLDYTRGFDGTSAATPLVAGVAALVRQANPALSWRDVREILALSARRNDALHPDWAQNPAGHWLNHDYGFGVVDAGAAVELATGWTPLPSQRRFESARIEPDLPIPDADPNGVLVTIPVSGSGIAQVEHVEVIVRSDHPFPPDLEIVLVSPVPGPTGTFVSVLAEPHDTEVATPRRLEGWRFGTLRHLGQAANGEWKLFVADHAAADVGRLQSVQLVFRGR